MDVPSNIANKSVGFRSDNITNYLRTNVNNFIKATGNSDFGNDVMRRFKDVTVGATYRAIQAAKNKYKRVFKQADTVQYITELSELQTAPSIMVNGLMACPAMKEAFNDDVIEGYGNRYDAAYADKMFVDDPNYRQVTNGMVIEEKGRLIVRNIYHENNLNTLSELEKISYLTAWKHMESHLEAGYDPTSEDNNMAM